MDASGQNTNVAPKRRSDSSFLKFLDRLPSSIGKRGIQIL
jgi:hypothetical protein